MKISHIAIIAGLILATIVGFTFSAQKTPTVNEYIKLKKRIAMLESQIEIMQSGWQGCLNEYERLMLDCKNSCEGKI